MNIVSRDTSRLAELRALQNSVGGAAYRVSNMMSLGDAPLDARLRGGLARSALHEIFAAETADSAAAAAFALMLALRCGQAATPIFWVREDRAEKTSGRLYGLGLKELGVDPAQFTIVHVPDARAALGAAAEITRCNALGDAAGAVVIQLHGNVPLLDLSATRRLALAAAQSGVLALVLRVLAEPQPSAAQSRWQVCAAASTALAANAPGRTALMIRLLRHRAGIPEFETRIEWDRDEKRCIEAPLSGAVSPLALRRAGETRKAA